MDAALFMDDTLSELPEAAPADASTELRVAELVRRFYDFVWRSLRRLGVRDGDADDAAQKVFLIATRKLEAIRPGCESSYLYQTAIRVASDYRRSKARRTEADFDQHAETPNPADTSPSIDELMDMRRARRQLDAILDKMPMDLRAVFVLHELEQSTMARNCRNAGAPCRNRGLTVAPRQEAILGKSGAPIGARPARRTVLVTELTPFVKSHPSPSVRRLLDSAKLDVPTPGSRDRALVALSHATFRPATTNFGGIALGTTVNRLIGAVTLYGSEASPWRLLGRGSLLGAAVGAAALAAIVGMRWLEAPADTARGVAAVRPTIAAQERPSTVAVEARQQALLRGAAVELDAGRPEVALESIESLLRANPSAKVIPQAILLKTRSLLRLGRVAEAQSTAAVLLKGETCPESLELRALLDAQSAAPAATSAK